MPFDRELYEEEFNKLLNLNTEWKFFIKESQAQFKIKKFITKAIDSFELAHYVKNSDQKAKDYWIITICYYSMLYIAKAAILTKGYETDDHYATQIALGHLLVPTELEVQDLEILNQSYKIFEDEYIEYFEDARKESSISKYSPTKIYVQRRVNEVFENARKFITKLSEVLKEWQ
jgi:uncharacterized protein (UPF0332 family)